MSPALPPDLFDTRRRALRLGRARLDQASFLHDRAADNALETIAATNRDFGQGLDLSDHAGLVSARAAEHGVGVAFAPARIEALSEGAGAALIVSVLSLHWVSDLPGALVRIRRALRPDGLFLGSILGGTTLSELRQVLMESELEILGGTGPRISPFADGFDGAALLQRAGFALPVCEVDRVSVRYGSVSALMHDLRAMGETHVLPGPVRPLRRDVLARAEALYRERFSDEQGRLKASFEIIHLAGWAPDESQQRPLRRGSATVRLADALGVREHTGEE
jgi:SAM-dependent methyltransferase